MPETPAAPPAQPRDLTSDLIGTDAEAMADLRRAEQEYHDKSQEIGGYYKDAADETNRVLNMQKSRIGDIETRVGDQEAAFRRLPEAPQAGPEPPVPSRQARPFGDLGQNPTAMQALNTTLYSLGLLAQMGMGMAKGYPNGALAAYTGALRGWAEGDALRAENMWKEYLGNVAKMTREYQRQRQEFQDILQKYSLSEDLLKNQLVVHGIKNGWEQRLIELAWRKPDQALKMFQTMEQPMNQVRHQTYALKAEMIKAALAKERQGVLDAFKMRAMQDRARRLDQAERFHQDTLKRMDQTMGLQANKALEPIARYPQAAVDLERIRTSLRSLHSRGLLADGSSLGAQKLAELKQKLSPNDPDYVLVRFLENPLTIGFFDRFLYDEKGARAMEIFKKQLQGFAPLSIQAGEGLINAMEDSMRTKFTTTRDLLRATAGNAPLVMNGLSMIDQSFNQALGPGTILGVEPIEEQ